MNRKTSGRPKDPWLTKAPLLTDTLPPLRCTALTRFKLEELMAKGHVPLSRVLRAIVGGFLLAGTQEDPVVWAGRELMDLDTLLAAKRHFEGLEDPNAGVPEGWPLAPMDDEWGTG